MPVVCHILSLDVTAGHLGVTKGISWHLVDRRHLCGFCDHMIGVCVCRSTVPSAHFSGGSPQIPPCVISASKLWNDCLIQQAGPPHINHCLYVHALLQRFYMMSLITMAFVPQPCLSFFLHCITGLSDFVSTKALWEIIVVIIVNLCANMHRSMCFHAACEPVCSPV